MIDFTSKRMKLNLSFPEKKLMECPLCGMGHPMYINGTVRDYHTDEVALHPNKGYSFCNCKNIWYTDWENIDQLKYHEEEKEHGTSATIHNIELRFDRIITGLSNYRKNIKTFLDVGCGLHYLDDMIHDELGWNITGIDINERLNDDKRKLVFGSVDDGVMDKVGKFDVIWASHILEHLHYPIEALKEFRKHLVDGGLLHILMPDPFYIDFIHPEIYPHFHIHQHHILWNLYDLILELKDIGFVVELSAHSPNSVIMEYNVLARNPTKEQKRFMKLMDGKVSGEVPIKLIEPSDAGHEIDNIDQEHREGAEEVKRLLKKGKKILPIACNYFGRRLDGFKRYLAFKELGYKNIPVVIEAKGGCQHNESWVVDG